MPISRRKGAAIQLLILAVVALTGCTPAGISSSRQAAMLEEVRTQGVIVGFEGLQPFSGFRIDDLTKQVGEAMGLSHAATSGNYKAHLRVVEEANKHGQPIYIVGYSMGGEQARLLAAACKERKIPVRVLFLLDPEYLVSPAPGKVPDNVRRAVFCTSSTFDGITGSKPGAENLANPDQTSLSVQDFQDTGHMGLPESVKSLVIKEVAEDMERK